VFADLFRYITISIKDFSLAKEGKKVLGSFCTLFERKKGGAALHNQFKTFYSKFAKNKWIFEFLSENTQFKNK
jgi:hypothetical protein